MDFEKPESDTYMILESLTLEKNSSRMIHIISASQDKTQFRLGRGHDSDVRVSDISVSRCHAIIKYVDGHFMLEDNLSKFGTLVLVKNTMDLEGNSTKAVQIGRTVISFSVKNIERMAPQVLNPEEVLAHVRSKKEIEFDEDDLDVPNEKEGHARAFSSDGRPAALIQGLQANPVNLHPRPQAAAASSASKELIESLRAIVALEEQYQRRAVVRGDHSAEPQPHFEHAQQHSSNNQQIAASIPHLVPLFNSSHLPSSEP